MPAVVHGPAAAYLLQRGLRRRAVTFATGLLGTGVLGVGVFPCNTDPHPLFAMLAFVAGGVAAVTSHRIVTGVAYPIVLWLVSLGGYLTAGRPAGMGYQRATMRDP